MRIGVLTGGGQKGSGQAPAAKDSKEGKQGDAAKAAKAAKGAKGTKQATVLTQNGAPQLTAEQIVATSDANIDRIKTELNLTPEKVKGKKFYFGEGCDKCNNLGFKGRTGLYELLIMNDDIRDMVSRGASTDQIRNYSRKVGTQSLRDAGLRALFAGTTTLDEVVRETVLEDENA